MNLSKSVFEIAEKFMAKPEFVSINYERLAEVANKMEAAGKPKFPTIENTQLIGAVLELVGNSINYCYWYGKHDIRPGDARSTLMYESVQNAFFDYTFGVDFEKCIERLIGILAMQRFPLLEERVQHLRELVPYAEEISLNLYNSDHEDIEPHMASIVSRFPGYGSDIFLKRASLYFLQLYRRYRWFEEALHHLHIPADYQVPRLMDNLGILEYSAELRYEIDSDRLIPKWSQKECEIRAATVLVAKDLCKELKWTVGDVDGYFWLGARGLENSFHLTITSDY